MDVVLEYSMKDGGSELCNMETIMKHCIFYRFNGFQGNIFGYDHKSTGRCGVIYV